MNIVTNLFTFLFTLFCASGRWFLHVFVVLLITHLASYTRLGAPDDNLILFAYAVSIIVQIYNSENLLGEGGRVALNRSRYILGSFFFLWLLREWIPLWDPIWVFGVLTLWSLILYAINNILAQKETATLEKHALGLREKNRQ